MVAPRIKADKKPPTPMSGPSAVWRERVRRRWRMRVGGEEGTRKGGMRRRRREAKRRRRRGRGKRRGTRRRRGRRRGGGGEGGGGGGGGGGITSLWAPPVSRPASLLRQPRSGLLAGTAGQTDQGWRLAFPHGLGSCCDPWTPPAARTGYFPGDALPAASLEKARAILGEVEGGRGGGGEEAARAEK